MAEIRDRLCNSRKQPPGGVLEKKVETLQCTYKGNRFSKDVNYNTTFCKMNFIKYGFDGISQSFLSFKMVYIFLEYFFQNISQMMLPNIYSNSI